MSLPDPGFWAGKRVLVTGHTGFKGSWLSLWLHMLGAQVHGFALAAQGTPNLFDVAQVADACTDCQGDVRDADVLAQRVREIRPEIVFHLAAQSLVREGYRRPLDTFSTNVMGTASLLDALVRHPAARVAVAVTTDKVYRNHEWAYPYREDDVIGGRDPYSASKSAMEVVVASYRDSYLADSGLALASARAGNVIGGGDWSADRLLPDAIRAWQHQAVLKVRNGASVRPWQHVLEPLCGYLLLAQALWQRPELAGAYNLGPQSGNHATVREVVMLAQEAYGQGSVEFQLTSEGPHEARMLTLETAKAHLALDFRARWDLQEAVRRSMHWYREQAAGVPAQTLCRADIADYQAMP